MGRSKDLATLKSGLSIDGTLTTTSTGTNLTSNSYNVVAIQTDKDDNGSNDDGILKFTTGSSNTVKGELRYDESENMFEIGHGDNQGHVRIDSSGHVTKPSQPYFAVEMRNNGNYQSRSATTALPFNSVALNTVSGSFDGSNYRYTAPVSGKYLMIAGGITNQANPTGRLQFYVNGSNEYTGQGSAAIKYGINGSNTAGGGSCLTSAIIPMTANDYVDVRSSSGTTHFYEHDHSFWTGMLLG